MAPGMQPITLCGGMTAIQPNSIFIGRPYWVSTPCIRQSNLNFFPERQVLFNMIGSVVQRA